MFSEIECERKVKKLSKNVSESECQVKVKVMGKDIMIMITITVGLVSTQVEEL